ncbi:hypothetical protein, variant 2 [Saprolegnia diclina VS20]|nr:hypothetical protein, variant 2 [Saprolegnia diclina VS20]EQC28175.1 hypothetical protein, variant 2 [Saprolegnia diclina VS20]|eukprot:XP_008618324.1 hypothetical protein, variant 2 [Saprolegnia diclina VS20]
MDPTELRDLERVLDSDDAAPSVTDLSAFLASTRDFGNETATHNTDGSRKRRVREKTSDEVAYLQSKQRYLLRQLELLRDKHAIPAHAGVWQVRAIEQAQAAERAKQENARLKALVHDQLALARGMERMLLKRPKLSAFPSMARYGVLGCEHRATDLRALLQHDYEAIESDHIRFGLHDLTARGTSTRKTFVETTVDDNLHLHFVRLGNGPFDYAALSNLVWEHMTTKLGPSTERLLYEAPDLVYTKAVITLDDPTMPVLEVRTAARRYDHDGRVVVVWRSIVHDALLPHAAGHLIDARHG